MIYLRIHQMLCVQDPTPGLGNGWGTPIQLAVYQCLKYWDFTRLWGSWAVVLVWDFNDMNFMVMIDLLYYRFSRPLGAITEVLNLIQLQVYDWHCSFVILITCTTSLMCRLNDQFTGCNLKPGWACLLYATDLPMIQNTAVSSLKYNGYSSS